MDYLPNADQKQIVDAFRDFLHAELPLSRLADERDAQRTDAALWPNFGELGWLAITQDESLDGSGLGMAEEMLLFTEAGKALVSPLLLGSVLGARVLQAAGEMALARTVVSGALPIAPALPLPGASIQPEGISGDFYLLDAVHCEYALICTPDMAAVVATANLTIEPQHCLDESVTLSKVSLSNCKPTATCGKGLFDRALILSAAMLTGIAGQALNLAVEYAKEREQFGKPVGSFQSIKHYCAEMALRHEAALSLTTQAALEFDADHSDRAFDAQAAKLTAHTAAVENAEHAIQIHGAMGFTSEMTIHLLLKRAHILSSLFADSGELVANLTALTAPDI